MPPAPTITTPFSERELRLLVAVCDTLAPALPGVTEGVFARAASDLNVPQILADVLYQIVDQDRLNLFKLALAALDQPLISGMIGSNARSFLDMPLDERTELLAIWAKHPLPLLRFGFQAFKRLALFFFYTIINADGRNPNWEDVGYAGPRPVLASASARPIQPLDLSDDSVMATDVVIVGSGAGGGVIAAELTAAGLDVIVLEKGGYAADADYHGREMDSTAQLFENKGLLSSDDLSVVVLAGSTLGGGTTINWCASFRTPDHVLAEWEQTYGVTGFTGADYQAALDAVSKRMNVNTDESMANVQNAALERGGQALGYQTGVIPRNVKGCDDCGFCNFGCAVGAKQSGLKTFLLDAYGRGARIAINAEAERVLVERGEARGVLVTAYRLDGHPVRVTIKARAVVVAAGAIHTPAVLMRSGLTNANIGRNLHLHPTSVAYGLYEEPVYGWSGPMMSRYVPEFSRLDDGYGVSLQTAPIHPGIAAVVLPWANGVQHKQMMQQLAHLGNIIAITRDREGGQIRLDRAGRPVIHYQLAPYDRAHLVRGVREALKIHHAAGAVEVGGPHSTPLVWRTGQDFERFLTQVEATKVRRNAYALLSAHQMSSCRMGSSPLRGAINPTGETFEVRNLFVADGSALPTALGVNPMLTIMGVAHVIAQHVKARLNAT